MSKEGEFVVSVERNTFGINIAYVEVKFEGRSASTSCENNDASIERAKSSLKRSFLNDRRASKIVEDSTSNGGVESNNMAFGKTSKKKGGVKKGLESKSLTGKGRVSRFTDEMKITVLHKDGNPRREGSDGHKSFEFYKKCKTVGDYLKQKGAHTGHLRWDVTHGYIKVS